MIKEEQLIFFTGIPGSAWAKVASLISYSPVLNLNDSDRHKDREFFLNRTVTGSWHDLVNHQGSFFGSKMEFGEGWEYPIERGLTKEAVMEDINEAFVAHSDQNYLIKSHSIAQTLEWWIENFPKAKFVFVFRDFEKSMDWWLNGGAFDIKYPVYDWYENEERMRAKARVQQNKSKEFIHANNIMTFGLTPAFLEEILQIDMEKPDNKGHTANDYYRAINAMPRNRDTGTPAYDIQIGFYGFTNLF